MIRITNILAALSQQTRLEVLTLLSRGPAEGQTSGALAIQALVPANSMSTHLAILATAGLVSATRTGRQVVYRIETEAIARALDNISARLIDKPVHQRFRPGLSIAAPSPVTNWHQASQKASGGDTSAAWPDTLLIREMVDDDPDRDQDATGPVVRLFRRQARETPDGDAASVPSEDPADGLWVYMFGEAS